ncbi:MAG TPA: hypothetical protein VHV29_10900 [Terriglobales bacterium]|nr:hypothetical protein [Terriglobales bacterium]
MNEKISGPDSGMLPDWTVIGFTGHRNLGDQEAAAQSISAALDALTARFGSISAISSLAKGSDTAFVRELARRKIPFRLVLPFPKERFMADFEPKDWQDVEPLLTQAIQVEEVTGTESDEEAYMDAGIRIVDLADVIVAVWDGQPADGLGGTGDVVSYARALHKPLQCLNPVTGEETEERYEQLPKNARVAGWNGAPRLAVEKRFQQLDTSASHDAPAARGLIHHIVLLHLAASAAGLIVLSLDIQGAAGYILGALEVVLLGTALLLTIRHHRKHEQWIRTRIEAEICRSFLATWPVRTKITRLPKLAIQGFERIMRNLQLAQQMDRSPLSSLECACHEYLHGRVEDQIVYFTRQGQEAQSSLRRLRRLAIASTTTAALLALVHFVVEFFGLEGTAVRLTGLLSITLPLVSAALLSLILTQEYSRRASRNREMVLMLGEAAERLNAVRTWNGLAHIAIETEEGLLNEAVEWHSFSQFVSQPH